MAPHHCRFCEQELTHEVVDLGASPLANAFLDPEQAAQPETHYPLRVFVCEHCWLVQLPEWQAPAEIFDADYAYFSSYSDSWLRHARAYVTHMQAEYDIGPHDFVVEVASNDGYLLQYFADEGVPVLGVEPARNVAQAAVDKGIPTVPAFFGARRARELRRTHRPADLLVGNNVLAHVPQLNDFVRGLRLLLAPEGILTIEVPHLLRLLQENQFDTIYHEHYSYFSLLTLERIFSAHGLRIFDVRELPTHGGSLRVYAQRETATTRPATARVERLRTRESEAGLDRLETYRQFGPRVAALKRQLLHFLLCAQKEGRTVAGYGAPAKGNTLLNYCGIRPDLLPYTVDRSPRKQGRFLPGSRIPVYAPEKIAETRPDYILILPWNLREEIVAQMTHVRDWGGVFVTPIPELTVIPAATHADGRPPRGSRPRRRTGPLTFPSA
jgi:SAM-dependent methyltransferase